MGVAERRRQQPARGHREPLRGLGRQGPPHGLCTWRHKSPNSRNRIGTQPSCKPILPSPGLLPPRMAAAAVALTPRSSSWHVRSPRWELKSTTQIEQLEQRNGILEDSIRTFNSKFASVITSLSNAPHLSQISLALMMRKEKRTPALPGVVFCRALEKILSARLKGRHRRGSATMSIAPPPGKEGSP